MMFLSDYPQAILVITGKEEDEKLRGIVKSLGIESNVYFAGFTSMPMLRAAIMTLLLHIQIMRLFQTLFLNIWRWVVQQLVLKLEGYLS